MMSAMRISVKAVQDLAERIEIGATLNAEVFSLRLASGDGAYTLIERVTILEKYDHFALTDHGAIEWTNLAIHNPRQLRKELMEYV